PYRGAVTGILLITLALAAVNAVEPLIFKYVFDGLASSPQARVLLIGIGSLLGLGVFREVASGFTNWLTWQTDAAEHSLCAAGNSGRAAPSHALEFSSPRRSRGNHDEIGPWDSGLHHCAEPNPLQCFSGGSLPGHFGGNHVQARLAA